MGPTGQVQKWMDKKADHCPQTSHIIDLIINTISFWGHTMVDIFMEHV